jgi:predicted ester cyclase
MRSASRARDPAARFASHDVMPGTVQRSGFGRTKFDSKAISGEPRPARASMSGALGRTARAVAVTRSPQVNREEITMSKEQENKAIVGRWFKEFWGNPWNPDIVDELAAPDILLQYSMHAPRRGRAQVKAFMTEFRKAFPDLNFWGAADLIAEGDYVVGRWDGGGTHTGPAFSDLPIGSLPAASGRKMRFTGTTVLQVKGGKIAEEIGLDDGVTALRQLGLIPAK